MRKILFLTTLLAFVLISSIWAADASGKWTVKMQSPMGGEETFELVIEDDGGNLTITGTHPQLNELTGTGIVSGDAIVMIVQAGEAPVQFAFAGRLEENMISGSREIVVTFPRPGTPEYEAMQAESAESAAEEEAAGEEAADESESPDAPAPPRAPISKDFTAEKI